MRRTFRYPLHPTVDQGRVLVEWLGMCQQLYNAALQHRRDAWEHEKRQRQFAEDRGVERQPRRAASYADQTRELTELRGIHEYNEIPVEIARSSLRRVEHAYQAFFRRCKNGETPGYPRFRALNRYDSFDVKGTKAFPLSVARDTRAARVHVPKLGAVKFHEYRPIRGKVLTTTIRRTAGKWFVCFVCDIGDAPRRVAVRNTVGIDVGLTTFATLSDGTEYENPRHYRAGETKLAARQQSLSRKQRGSNSRRHAKLLVAKAHEHTRNQRSDHARKLAAVLVAKYDLIAYEDLNIRGMVHGNLAKSIHDAAWGKFIHALTCKAESAGKWCVPVDPRGTSQRCSMCGATVAKTLSDRIHWCACGHVEGRDLNAAKNILALGRSVVAGVSLTAAGLDGSLPPAL
jgi:putative transposase